MMEEKQALMEIDKLLGIIDQSVVIDEHAKNDSVAEELKEVPKELTDDRNVFRFSNYSRDIVFYDAIIGAIESKPLYNPDVKERYEFLRYFRFYYHIGRGALKGAMLNKYTELGSSILAFRGALEWRQAGVMQQGNLEENKGIVDRLKRR